MTVGRYLWTVAAEWLAVVVCGGVVFLWVQYMTHNDGLAGALAGITGLVGGFTSVTRIHRAIESASDSASEGDDDDVGQIGGRPA